MLLSEAHGPLATATLRITKLLAILSEDYLTSELATTPVLFSPLAWGCPPWSYVLTTSSDFLRIHLIQQPELLSINERTGRPSWAGGGLGRRRRNLQELPQATPPLELHTAIGCWTTSIRLPPTRPNSCRPGHLRASPPDRHGCQGLSLPRGTADAGSPHRPAPLVGPHRPRLEAMCAPSRG